MQKETPKPKVAGRILLVASLALNLVVAGVIAGAVLSGGPGGGGQRFDLTAGALTRAMDDNRRAEVRAALRESDAFRPRDRLAIRRDMATLIATLRGDTFDEAAFREALLRQRARLADVQSAALDAASAQISLMDAQERAEFADRLEEQLRRGAPRRRDEGLSGG